MDVEDKLFSTLDPVTRKVRLPSGRDLLVTDTVGFIQKLPTQLASAFKATLEELESAELLVHVVDATSEMAAAQAETVLETLADLGLEQQVLTALNKVDGLELPDGRPVEVEADLKDIEIVNPAGSGEALLTSALRGWGIDRLRQRIAFEVLGEPAVLATS